jgi:hypothetical protein
MAIAVFCAAIQRHNHKRLDGEDFDARTLLTHVRQGLCRKVLQISLCDVRVVFVEFDRSVDFVGWGRSAVGILNGRYCEHS